MEVFVDIFQAFSDDAATMSEKIGAIMISLLSSLDIVTDVILYKEFIDYYKPLRRREICSDNCRELHSFLESMRELDKFKTNWTDM